MNIIKYVKYCFLENVGVCFKSYKIIEFMMGKNFID